MEVIAFNVNVPRFAPQLNSYLVELTWLGKASITTFCALLLQYSRPTFSLRSSHFSVPKVGELKRLKYFLNFSYTRADVAF